jgi:hypothetical protein
MLNEAVAADDVDALLATHANSHLGTTPAPPSRGLRSAAEGDASRNPWPALPPARASGT